MNTDNNFQHLEHEDSHAVVSFDNGTTFKVSKLMEKTNSFLQQFVLNSLSEKLAQAGLGSTPNRGYFYSGVNAEILEPKSGEWKKGKVRMRVVLEFCPDEPEIKEDSIQRINSLDDIRSSI